jgi:hypothetical protein
VGEAATSLLAQVDVAPGRDFSQRLFRYFMTPTNVFSRPGRYSHEVIVRLLEEYGPRGDWPAGLGTAAKVLFALNEQLPSQQFTRTLEAVRQPTPPATADVDERLA